MKQLELQQEREERELLERAGKGEAVSASESAASASEAKTNGSSGPVRSQSGNDLASFGAADHGDAESDNAAAKANHKYANAKSMPGSRRHSGEIKDVPATSSADGTQQKKDGQPMLNSFLFDDDLDDDLKSASLETLRSSNCIRRSHVYSAFLDSAWGGKYLQMNADDDKFPVLVSAAGLVTLDWILTALLVPSTSLDPPRTCSCLLRQRLLILLLCPRLLLKPVAISVPVVVPETLQSGLSLARASNLPQHRSLPPDLRTTWSVIVLRLLTLPRQSALVPRRVLDLALAQASFLLPEALLAAAQPVVTAQ